MLDTGWRTAGSSDALLGTFLCAKSVMLDCRRLAVLVVHGIDCATHSEFLLCSEYALLRREPF